MASQQLHFFERADRLDSVRSVGKDTDVAWIEVRFSNGTTITLPNAIAKQLAEAILLELFPQTQCAGIFGKDEDGNEVRCTNSTADGDLCHSCAAVEVPL